MIDSPGETKTLTGLSKRADMFRRLDAGCKLGGVMASFVVVATAYDAGFLLQSIMTIFPISLLLVSGADIKSLIRRFVFVLGFIAFAFFFVFVVNIDPSTKSLQESRFLFLIAATIFGITSTHWVASTTHPIELMGGLRRLRIPENIVWMIVLALRYTRLIGEEGKRLHRAAKARGFAARDKALPTKNTIRTMGHITSSVIQRSFQRALRTAQAMEARGYGSPNFKTKPTPLSWTDLAFLFLYPSGLIAVRVAGYVTT